jgi:predicted enzyme related to lactoylglutathione lyase
MMGMIVNIDVPDLDAAVSFYTAAIGLRLARLLDDDVAELTGASCPIFLLMRPAGVPPAPGVTRTREYVRHWSPIHPDFVVDDLEAAVRRAIDAGATRETGVVTWRGSRCVTLSDPFGHGFCLIEFDNDTYAES